MAALPQERVVISREHLDDLFQALAKRGFEVIGPTVRDGAVVYDAVESTRDLPAGWTDEQNGGHYRLKKRDDEALFGYVVGPHSWKKFLHPPVRRLWKATRADRGFAVEPDTGEPAPKYAFIGVRSCELHAMAVHDRVFVGGRYVDPVYLARRESAFIVAVNCGQAGGTCFCVSMGTGPRAASGFDLALTEILDDGGHRFVVEVGSERGRALLDRAGGAPATDEDGREAQAIVERTARSMGRRLDTDGVKDLLYRNLEHPRWDDVAARCLTCANCTLVCPTCFCTTVEDVSDLTGDHAERWRRWDSCFNVEFSYIHGGSVRPSPRARYRQWLTHKLATWIDQFGTSGCVGCGRCITWCPVAIDITEEVAAIRASDQAAQPSEELPE